MNSDQKYPYRDLSFVIIGALFEVYNRLGFGYPERVYQKALAEELSSRELEFSRESFSRISYKGKVIGKFFNDFLIEGKIILELKIGDNFYQNQFRQIISYLRDKNLKLGILAVFTPKEVLVKRVINSYLR